MLAAEEGIGGLVGTEVQQREEGVADAVCRVGLQPPFVSDALEEALRELLSSLSAIFTFLLAKIICRWNR